MSGVRYAIFCNAGHADTLDDQVYEEVNAWSCE
jgi:hypothetical protein